MTIFKISFADIPDVLLRDIEGEQVLVLEIPSLQGRKRYWLKDGDEIEASDVVMEMSLASYECPKIPITRLSPDDKVANEKAEKKKSKKKATSQIDPSPMFYDVADVQGKKPFSKVRA